MEKEVFGPDLLSVDIEVNVNCSETEHHVLVTFGRRGSNGCRGHINMTEGPLSPGDTASFHVSTDSLPQGNRCYLVRANGNLGE